MKEYEIIIESITPCGGSKYAIRKIVEAEAESPEAYVEQHKRFPIRDTSKAPDGSVVIPEVLRSYMGGTEVLIPKK